MCGERNDCVTNGFKKERTKENTSSEEGIDEENKKSISFQNCCRKDNEVQKVKLALDFEHCVKSALIWSFSGPYLPVFSPNTGK